MFIQISSLLAILVKCEEHNYEIQRFQRHLNLLVIQILGLPTELVKLRLVC